MNDPKKQGDIIVEINHKDFSISVEADGYGMEQVGTKRKCSTDIDAVMKMLDGRTVQSKFKAKDQTVQMVQRIKN